MRRTPAAIAPSLTIRKSPIRPVDDMCVPPHSSMEEPKRMVRTTSSYFSPNSAIAPISFAL